MYKRLIISMAMLITVGQLCFSQGSGIGIGSMLGNPTGITGKGWVTKSGAIQLSIGWPSLDSHGGTALSFEYLWHSHIFRSRERLPIFYGLGGFFGVAGGSDIIATRGVFGITWWPRNTSLDVFLQILPAIYFEPKTEFDFDFGFGVRFFF